MAAHLVLVFALGAGGSSNTLQQGGIGTAVPHTTLRWIAPASPLNVPLEFASREGPTMPDSSMAEPLVANRVVLAPPTEHEATPDPVPASTGALPLPQPSAAPPAGEPPVDVMGVEPVDGYLPRKALTVPPSPLGRVDLAWPEGVWTLGHQAAVFTVFIDETGVVRKMVADGPTLLPTLEATARDTFMATPFAPGEVDGRPVKAMIRVEVVFDASLPRAPASGERFRRWYRVRRFDPARAAGTHGSTARRRAMARQPRLAIDGQLHHLLHRAGANGAISLGEDDRADFVAALLTVSREARVAVHAYAVLPDRVQLLCTPEHAAELAKMMQRLGRRYVGAFNARHGAPARPGQGATAPPCCSPSATWSTRCG